MPSRDVQEIIHIVDELGRPAGEIDLTQASQAFEVGKSSCAQRQQRIQLRLRARMSDSPAAAADNTPASNLPSARE